MPLCYIIVSGSGSAWIMDKDTNTVFTAKKPRLSCNVLKLIACIFMFTDHFGYGVLHNYLLTHGMDLMPEEYKLLNTVYEVCHGIGRLAFPIFCFFIVEGFLRTRSILKYMARMAVFAVISEIPFDLGLYGVPFRWEHQNIMVTFLIALIMLSVIRYIGNIRGLSYFMICFTSICAVIAFSDIAVMLNADYSWKCMLLTAVLYFTRNTGTFRLLAGAAATSWEKYAPLSFLLLYFYDPQTRPVYKYAFYLFYPLHLLVIYMIAWLLI